MEKDELLCECSSFLLIENVKKSMYPPLAKSEWGIFSPVVCYFVRHRDLAIVRIRIIISCPGDVTPFEKLAFLRMGEFLAYSAVHFTGNVLIWNVCAA